MVGNWPKHSYTSYIKEKDKVTAVVEEIHALHCVFCDGLGHLENDCYSYFELHDEVKKRSVLYQMYAIKSLCYEVEQSTV